MTIQEKFQKKIDEAENPYLLYHRKRLREIVKFLETNLSKNSRILDIGNSPLSEILSTIFEVQIDELGFYEDSVRPFGMRFQFDLNHCDNKSLWRHDIKNYDLIIFTEVIEHLYTSPSHVLAYLYSLLNLNGKLFLQTPNAVVFHKRIQMLLGKNPFMHISPNKMNPLHYREYTLPELKKYAVECEFDVEESSFNNYFDYRYTHAQSSGVETKNYLELINHFYSILPSSLKPGISLVLSKGF